MKKILLTLTFFCFALLSLGQIKKSVDIPLEQNGDTSNFYKWHIRLCSQLKIQKLITLNEPNHFRIWQDGQAIDIWTKDNKTYQGSITNYMIRFNPNKWKKGNHTHDKVFSNLVQLDTVQAHRIFDLIHIYMIESIPTDHKIKTWNHGLVGTTFIIENSTMAQYNFKEFTAIDLQKNIPEVKQIQQLLFNLSLDLKLQNLYKEFIGSLPNGTFTNGKIILYKNSTFNYEQHSDYEEEIEEHYFFDNIY
jgi:hypothetical protein